MMNNNRQNPTSVGILSGGTMDRRTARADQSRAALKKAFLELFQTKEPEEITVVELCRKAGLNRSTFYAHYSYVDELIKEIIWDCVKDVYFDLGTQWNLPLDDGGVDRKIISTYIHRFLNNPTLRRFCTCDNSEKYRTLIIRAQIELTLGESKDPARYYIAYFYNAGVLNFTQEWFSNGMPLHEDSFVEIIHEFSKVMYGMELLYY